MKRCLAGLITIGLLAGAVVGNAFDDAAEAMGVTVERSYGEKFDVVTMAQNIEAAVASNPDGLIVSIPDIDAVRDSILKAVEAGATDAICFDQEVGNVALDLRCEGESSEDARAAPEEKHIPIQLVVRASTGPVAHRGSIDLERVTKNPAVSPEPACCLPVPGSMRYVERIGCDPMADASSASAASEPVVRSRSMMASRPWCGTSLPRPE